MDNKYTFIRVLRQTGYKLKILAATQHKSMLEVFELLVTAECERLHIPLEVGIADESDEEAHG